MQSKEVATLLVPGGNPSSRTKITPSHPVQPQITVIHEQSSKLEQQNLLAEEAKSMHSDEINDNQHLSVFSKLEKGMNHQMTAEIMKQSMQIQNQNDQAAKKKQQESKNGWSLDCDKADAFREHVTSTIDIKKYFKMYEVEHFMADPKTFLKILVLRLADPHLQKQKVQGNVIEYLIRCYNIKGDDSVEQIMEIPLSKILRINTLQVIDQS